MTEEFEKWAMQAPLYLPMGKAKDGGYYFSETSVAWLAWQASRKQAIEECAALVAAKLTELTREMENYTYFENNPGVSVDDYEVITDAIRALQQQ